MEILDSGAAFLSEAGLATDGDIAAKRAWFERATETARERITTYSDLPAQLAYLFAEDGEVEYDDKALKGVAKQGTEHLAAWRDSIGSELADPIDAPALGERTKAWIAKREIKIPQLFQPLRCALTGKGGGPDLFEVMALLGADRTLARIDHGLERFASAASPS